MKHFFTKSTVEAKIWCVKCGRETMHKIDGGRPIYCAVCMEKLLQSKKEIAQKAEQGNLF